MSPLGKRCPGPLSRRSVLEVGALSIAGLGCADLLRLQSEARAEAKTADDPAVIFVWLPGGPPHMDMYDMKPEAPEEYRGVYRPIATNVPGIDVCELMPRHAKAADKYAIVRSVSHKFADHGGGHKRFLTGRDPNEPAGFVNDYPMVGSSVSKMLETRKIGMPNYIAGVDGGRQGIDTFSFGSSYLGASTHPFMVAGDPSRPEFKVQNLSLAPGVLSDRLDDRASLLRGLDTLRNDLDASGRMDSIDKFSREALDLVLSPRAREAFDLTRESTATRERYGMNPWGQRALLSRRLVEAGAKFVTMVMENPLPVGTEYPKDFTYNWDSHAVNCHIFTDLQVRLPVYDQAIITLIEDLYARGLDRRVLLVVTGEFGRSPRIETAKDRPGRDHWPAAMSMLLSGGGLKMGQVIGSTTPKGETPKDRPLTPNDMWATVLRHLGIDPAHSFLDHQGRPLPILPFGSPISELF